MERVRTNRPSPRSYVSAYPALVKTINELFGRGTQTLVMAWDRRMDESKAFFDMMEAEGYACRREPKCIFVFTR